MNEKILEALQASLKRVEAEHHKETDRIAAAFIFCKAEDLRLAIAAHSVAMEAESGGVAE